MKYICEICNEKFETIKQRNKHLKLIHNLTFEEYIVKTKYNGIYPTCKCGCGTKLKFKPLADGPWFSEYTKNHRPYKKHSESTKQLIKQNTKKAIQVKYGVNNVFVLKEIKKKIKESKLEKYNNENYNNIKKIKQTKLKNHDDKNYNNPNKRKETNLDKYNHVCPAVSDVLYKKSLQTKLKNQRKTNLNKYGYETNFINPEYRKKYNSKTSKIEKEIAIKLNAEHKFIFKNKEFDIKLNNTIIEIDGDFWHPSNINNLTLSQLSSIKNDVEKMNIIENSKYELIKIHVSNLPDTININNIKNNSYVPNYTINNSTVIISKKYLKKYIDKKGKNKLEQYVTLIWNTIKLLQPEFPFPNSNENIDDIINKIQNYDLNKLYNSKTFNNNCSLIGVKYLKSNFKSYWYSKYNGNQSPIEAWKNDEFMKKIIADRIGINNRNEVFDLTLNNIIYGMSVNKINISFFKPILAASIYKHFIGDINNPVVIDPCAGFGGRLVGFKNIYPNGTYIGIEPNIDTYNELKELTKNFNNVYLYNIKLEDFDISKYDNIDLTFTSIPYFDTEIYSNSIDYNSIENWINTFIKSLMKFPNCLINVNDKFKFVFDDYNYDNYKISNSKSPIVKNNKNEWLLKFF